MINLLDHMPFANLLGIEISETEKDRIVGVLTVSRDICTTGKMVVRL